MLCINCGHSFAGKGKGKKLDTRVTQMQAEAAGSERKSSMGGAGRMALGLAVTSVVGVICCIGWLILMVAFDIQIGLLAWGIGGIVGLTAGLIGRNPSPIYCGLTAVIAGASIVGAKAIYAATLSLVVMGASWSADMAETIFDEFSPERFNLSRAVMQDMLNNGEFSGTQEQYARITTDTFFGVQFASEPETDAYWEAGWDVDEQVEAKLGQMSEAEQAQALAAAQSRHPNWVGDPYLYQAAAAQLVEREELPVDLSNHAKQTVVYMYGLHSEQAQTEWNDDYGDWLENDTYMTREFGLLEKIGAHVATLDNAQREQLIAETKAANPDWVSSREDLMAEANEGIEDFQDELDEMGASDSFGRNLFMTLGAFDLIFLALAVGTAYSVAYAKGA